MKRHGSMFSGLRALSFLSMSVLVAYGVSGCSDGESDGKGTPGAKDNLPEDKQLVPGQPYEKTLLDSGINWELSRITGTLADDNGEAYDETIYSLYGQAPDSPLPDRIKEEIPADAPDPTVYLINAAIVDEIVASEKAGKLSPMLEAIAEPPDDGTGNVDSGSKEAKVAGPFGSCSSQIVTKSKSLSLNTPASKSFNLGGGFVGSVAADVQASGSATGEVQFEIKRTKVFWVCIPYGAKFEYARVNGQADVQSKGTLSGAIQGAYQWDTEIVKPHLGSLDFAVGPVPVHIGFNLPITLGVDIKANVNASLSFDSTRQFTGTFDYTCTLGGCLGSSSYQMTNPQSPVNTTASLQGRVEPSIWAQAAVRAFLYDEWIAYAQVGVRPYLYGDLWGYVGNQCGDADGNGTAENVSGLTFDLDWQLFLTGQASAFGGKPKQWNDLWHTTRAHLGFWDLTGSSAISPMINGAASTGVGIPATYSALMRPCWPYNDEVNYLFSWGDGATSGLSGAPQSSVSATHTWGQTGQYSLNLSALSDSHGRVLNESTAKDISVQQSNPMPIWTSWFDRDNPSGVGDYETLKAFLQEGYPVCASPIGVECQTLGGVDWTQTGEVVTCNPQEGGYCVNSQQSDGSCQDYRVRFLCP